MIADVPHERPQQVRVARQLAAVDVAADEIAEHAAEVFVPKLNAWRVTITKPVIRAAKVRMILCAGASKRPILEQVRAGADYPIAQVTSDAGETWWFVDRAAAPEI